MPHVRTMDFGYSIKRPIIYIYNITQFQQRARRSQVKEFMILNQMPKVIRDPSS